jgi:hypothetical protein
MTIAGLSARIRGLRADRVLNEALLAEFVHLFEAPIPLVSDLSVLGRRLLAVAESADTERRS